MSPIEREKRDRRDSRGDEREGQGRKRDRNEIKETDEIKTFLLYPYPLQGLQALPNCKPISVGRPSDVRYTTPCHTRPPTPLSKTSLSLPNIFSADYSKIMSLFEFFVSVCRFIILQVCCFVLSLLVPCHFLFWCLKRGCAL